MPLGQGHQNQQLEAPTELSVSHPSLLDSFQTRSDSNKSISSLSWFYLTSNDTTKSTSSSKINQLVSDSNKISRHSINDGIRMERVVHLEVPDAVETESFMRQTMRRKLEFAERGHSFQRSKSWAKYHGSHVKNRPPRIHRRSRSDLGGLLPNPLHEMEIGVNGATQDNCTGRSGLQRLCLVSLFVSVVVLIIVASFADYPLHLFIWCCIFISVYLSH